jgi:hypothetical protein
VAYCKALIVILLVLSGMAVSISAGAATIEAARIQGEIPVNPSDVFWSRYLK